MTEDATRGALVRGVADDAGHRTRLGRFAASASAAADRPITGHHDLVAWSVEDPDAFWRHVSDELGVPWHARPDAFLADAAMPGARWCPGGTLNYAEAALAHRGEAPAIIARSQTRDRIALSRDELRDAVARCAAGLRRLGVGRGSRVAAYLPNVPEAVIGLLASAALGATWASCPPEFGVRSVVDRLGQLEPDVLLCGDGYRYGAKAIDRRAQAAEIVGSLPSLRHVVAVPYLHDDGEDRLAGAGPARLTWEALLAEPAAPRFEPVPFDHPLYVLFSSGTTGLPKPIVHGHGGMTLEHLKALALMQDLRSGDDDPDGRPQDRFFWFSTTGWMMWNYLVSGLLVGAAIVLFDGDPGAPDLGETWRMAGEEGVTQLGTSAPFLMACRKAGLVPREIADLAALRLVGSTGAPLPAEGWSWVYEAVAPRPVDPAAPEVDDLLLSSISGGTDVCTAFVGGSPLLPVRAGEISGAWPGCDVQALGEDGTVLHGETGELVIGSPMPSMPIGLLGDEDGSRYRASYFERFPGRWCHGDWVTVRDDGSLVIGGRSDATLNRGGVRLGTAEIYRVVEEQEGVADSLVVHLEDEQDPGGAGRLLLFVAPAGGVPEDEDRRDALRDELAATCARALRGSLSPRHVPDELRLVAAIPTTLSGKKLEVPVKRILTGTPPDQAASRESLRDPAALEPFVALAAARA